MRGHHLVLGVAFQSLRDLLEPGCEPGQYILIVRIVHALGDSPSFPRLLTECRCDTDRRLVPSHEASIIRPWNDPGAEASVAR